MKHNKISNEYTISIKELCWRILEQWKLVVIVAICVLALFLGVMQSLNLVNAKKSKEAQQKERPLTSQEIIKTLPKDEQTLVASAFRLWQEREQYSAFIDTSPIMKIDPNHTKRLRTSWVVDCGEDKSKAFEKSYVLGVQSKECREALLRSSGADMNDEQFSSLINIIHPDIEGIVCCDIYLTDVMDAEAVQNELKNQVGFIHDRLNNEIGEHQVSNYQSEIGVVADSNVLKKQTEVLTGYGTINNLINNIKTTFSANQEAAFSRLRQGESAGEAVKQTSPHRKVLTARNVLLGLLLGVFVYAGFFLIIIALSNRVISTDVAEESSGRLLGEWYSGSSCPGNCLIKDRSVWKRHHRKHLDKSTEEEKAYDAIVNLCKYKSIDSLLLVGTQKCSHEQDAFVRDLSQRLDDSGIKTRFDRTSGVIDNEAMLLANAVALIIIDGKTTADDIVSVLSRCNDYEKTVLGSIYLG